MPTVDVYVSIDSYLSQSTPDTNFGTAVTGHVGFLFLGGLKSDRANSIGNFDISALAGETLVSASLHRHVVSIAGGGFDAWASRCTRPTAWTEGGVTWSKYDGVSAWTTGGGDWDGALTVGYTEATDAGAHIISGLLALAQDALANRAGILSVGLRPAVQTEGNHQVQFASREQAPSWFLRVSYAGVAVPEPGRREVAERELAFDLSREGRGVRPVPGARGVRGVVPVGGVA